MLTEQPTREEEVKGAKPRGLGRKKEMGSRGEAAFDSHLEERVSADRARCTDLLESTEGDSGLGWGRQQPGQWRMLKQTPPPTRSMVSLGCRQRVKVEVGSQVESKEREAG